MIEFDKVAWVDRVEYLRSFFDKTQLGLEIGPSHNPLIPKREGYRVKIIDALDQEALIAKYQILGISPDAIEEVDYVWRGERISDIVADGELFDYIIASHVFEHLPNPLGFLSDCYQILKPNGRVILAVPDKRKCFDYWRMPSSTGQILQAYVENRTTHSLAAIFDFTASYANMNGLSSWFLGTFEADKVNLANNTQLAYEILNNANHSLSYVDVHGWVFTPASFLLIIKELAEINLLMFSLLSFAVSDGHEFYAVFQKTDNAKNPLLEPFERLELHEQIAAELNLFRL